MLNSCKALDEGFLHSCVLFFFLSGVHHADVRTGAQTKTEQLGPAAPLRTLLTISSTDFGSTALRRLIACVVHS